MFESWLKKGAKGTEPFATLVAAIDQAEATLESVLTNAVLAGSENPQVAMKFLERRFPNWSDHAAKAAIFGTDESNAVAQAFRIIINIPEHYLESDDALPQRAIDVTPPKPPPVKDPDPFLN
jgi:hypothetical protein